MNRQSKFPHFTWSHFTTMQIKTKQAYLHELTMEQVRCSSLERNKEIIYHVIVEIYTQPPPKKKNTSRVVTTLTLPSSTTLCILYSVKCCRRVYL